MATKKTETTKTEVKKTTRKKTAPKRTAFKGWEEIIRNNVVRYKCPKCGAELRKMQIEINYHRCPVCGADAEEV